jgi:thioredoxin reductase (NADPH)
MLNEEIKDLIIVGAGPAGLSAAYAAKQQGLKYLLLERSEIASTVRNYPVGKPLFSTANELEFEPHSMKTAGNKPTREEILDYYLRFACEEQHLCININEAVEAIMPGKLLTVHSTKKDYQAKSVLVAVGGMGLINKLNVSGEIPTRVSYLFYDAAPFRGKKVLVVGGGNSAAEASLYLCEGGAEVTFIMRRAGWQRRAASDGAAIKPWVQQPLEAAINADKIRACFATSIIAIGAQSATLERDGQPYEVECDHIFALIGTRPDNSLLLGAGVLIGEDGRPEYDPQTYETNVTNLFVIGHLTRELHMKNAVNLPPRVIAFIADRQRNQQTEKKIFESKQVL